MSDLAEAFLLAVETTLRGSPELAAAMGLAQPRIFVERPGNAPKPYVLIGDDQLLDDGDACQVAGEIFATVHVWAASDAGLPGSRRARRIGAALEALLTGGLAVAGHEVVVAELDSARYLTDPAGSTHGVLTFRYLTSAPLAS